MIKVTNLTKTFESKKSRKWFFRSDKETKEAYTAVDNLSFEVQEGEFIAFLGPNGAGKTTTLKMLSGILHPSSGEIRVCGFIPYERKKEFQKIISFVMAQKSQLFLELPVRNSLEFIGEVYDIPRSEYLEKIERLSTTFRTEKLLEKSARKLSLGQRMKCELIASLMYDPKVIFLDEPTIGLDVNSAIEVREFLKELNQKFKTTIILTTHNMNDVEELCDRTVVINFGKKIFDGSTKELKSIFGNKREIEFVLDPTIKSANMPQLNDAEILEQTDSVLKVRCEKKDSPAIISEVMNKLKVEEVNFNEADLSKIISKIYKNEHV